MAMFRCSARHAPQFSGPDQPSELSATLVRRAFHQAAGAASYPVLLISCGRHDIEIEMIERKQIEQLRASLGRILEEGALP